MKTSQNKKDQRPLDPKDETFKSNENVQYLLDQLRDSYITYKEAAMRCQTEFRTSSSGDGQKFYYFPPEIPQLDDPEKQKVYRKKFLQDICQISDPEPLILNADVYHLDALKTIGDRSNPTIQRQDLATFFKRRLAQLQHKKYKILCRWSNQIMSSEYIDKTSLQLDQSLGRIQREIDLTLNRVERLQADDSYNTAKSGQRPHPTAKESDKDHKPLYLESGNVTINSSIRLDDVETFLRIQTYRNKLFRLSHKLVQDIKWLPYSHRFDIWGESRAMMMEMKDRYNKQRQKLTTDITVIIRNKLEANGVTEERVLNAIIDKFTHHLRPRSYQSKQEQLLDSYQCNYEMPPIMVSNNIELKIQLIDIARQFGITGDLEIDNGHSFTYQVQVYFPTHFQKQVLLLQWDWYDTSGEVDAETIEKISRNLNLSRLDVVTQMAKFSEIERKKSTIGKINSEDLSKVTPGQKQQFKEFFSLDESEYKLKRADWLEFVCFTGEINEQLKRQQHYLNQIKKYDGMLESAFNFLDVNDGAAVNKILEESAQAHSKTTAHKRNQLRRENPLYQTKEDEIQSNLKIAFQKVQTLQEQIQTAELPLLETLPPHIIRAYYTLRYIKTRDYKLKLLHMLNYFRSIQKRLALDIRYFSTRDRAIGDIEIINPQFGKDPSGNQRVMLNGNSGPGGIFANLILRRLDDPEIDSKKNHPISIKALKYNMLFNPQISSTNPCLPRMHVTFGRPRLYEEVSSETDKEQFDKNNNRDARSFMGWQDKIEINENDMDILISDEFGIKIIYEEAVNDIVQLEEELLKIGSYFIVQQEFVLDADIKEPLGAIDRGEMALQLYELESQFQFEKVLLIEQHMECYEHTTDPLEQMRLIQLIADLMVQRPRLNMEGSTFIESYQSEIEMLKQKMNFLRELSDLQVEIEETENEEIRSFQELKFRKVRDHMLNEWKYDENLKREEKVGAQEDEVKKAPVTDQLKSRLEQKGIVDPEKRQRMKEIAQRHITEYASNQYMDFQDVLGLPEVTAEQLYNKQGQKEPVVTDCMREHSHFSKQMDGYPWFFAKRDQRLNVFRHHRDIGIFDFYDSLSCMSKVQAAMVQTLQELIKVHTPENGLAQSCLERAMIIEARGKLKILRTITLESDYLLTKSTPKIEEDFYLSNSDKLIFCMREFKSHFNPEQVSSKANPLLVGRLDIDSVSKFNFPRLRQSDIPNNQELTQEQILAKMIDLAKITIVQQTQEEKLIGGNMHIEEFLEKKGQSQLPEIIKSPPMMILSCNLIEAIRLREELIQRIHETDILSIIYKNQMKLVNKDGTRLVLQDSINFDVQSIIKDNLNMIDYNDGMKYEFDLAFREFDSTLKANLDFKSESCIKALMTDLGLEELRAVVHYQLMQQQILTIGVLINQQIMDGCMRGLSELDFLQKKKQFIVPNSVINVSKLLTKSADGYNQDAFNREKNNLRQLLQREVAEHIYSINAKKSKQRPYTIKRYSNVLAKVQTFTHKPETKLRILKSYRLRLLHQFCKDVLKEAYQDSLKVQILQTTQQLRQKAFLLPEDSRVFSLGLSEILESISWDFLNKSRHVYKAHPKFNSSQLLTHKFDTMFYLPSTDEIMNIESRTDEQKEIQLQSQAQYTDQISEQFLDQQLKDLLKPPTICSSYYKLDDQVQISFRKVIFNEAYQYTSQCYKLLNYLTLVNRIFTLEYVMGRNNSPGLDILEMEDHILSGRQYWEKNIKQRERVDESDEPQQISDVVINRIVNQRKARIDLAEDLTQIALRLKKIEEYPRKYSIENLKIESMIGLLNLHHNMLYHKFLNGIESLLETYLDKQNNECYQKIWKVKDMFLRNKLNIDSYQNGFNMNGVMVKSLHQSLGQKTLDDNEEFLKSYQPIIDEQQLIPAELKIVSSYYSQQAHIESQYMDIMNNNQVRDYQYIQNSFLNFNDQERAYIFTNFFQIDESLNDYLVFREVGSRYDSVTEILSTKLEYLQSRSEQKLLQNVMMTWINKGQFSKSNTVEFEKLLKQYKDQMLLKILQERDLLNEQYQRAKEKKAETKKGSTLAEQGIKISQEALFDMFDQKMKEQHMNDKINETKAEIIVVKRELELRMIKQSLQMIKNEHSSLLATFEQAATEKEINVFVHPQQQFAATLHSQVDRNSHLDVVNKLSFVQSFLTKLRNRCTEVETLTSGPGIVFSMKDFNDCLQQFCKGLLKYGEQELRTRIESQYLREAQYRHLIYLKDQQNLYYRRKCELFLRDIDKLINAKLTQKGNQIIYELDISNRELRLLKDNFYLMERLMREEVRHEYEKIIQEKDNIIHRFKESFTNYKNELNNEIKEEVAKEILSLDKKVKQIAKREHNLNNQSNAGKGVLSQISKMLQSSDNQLSFQTTTSPKYSGQNQGYYDAQQVKEINSLHRFIRKYKILTKMKEVLAQEKHERELFHQKQKLTSNECLWDQLAEAEKREQIVRQELYYTQQSLASYEKLIEKLQVQLESLQSQKLRLQQYKNSKSKRIEELESKMREIEILENIDLNKVLEELRQRDKKLRQINLADRDFNSKIDTMNKINQRKVTEMQRKINQEKELKTQAFEKLDNMRLEMKALEGRDFANDLWKEKCKELFDICKDLQKENDDLKVLMSNQQQQIQVLTDQTQQMSTFQQQIPTINTSVPQGLNLPGLPYSPMSNLEKMQVFSSNSGSQTTKPQSASTKFGGQTRLMSRGTQGLGGLQTGMQTQTQLGQILSQPGEHTLTSGLSLPEIAAGSEQEGKHISQSTSNQRSDFRSNQFITQNHFGRKKSRDNALRLQSQDKIGMITTGTLTSHQNKPQDRQFVDPLYSGLYGGMPDQLTMTSGLTQQQNIPQNSGAKSQQRGVSLIQQQKQKTKRLKTSHGGRRNEQASQTTGGVTSLIQNYNDGTNSVRKSLNQRLHQNIAASIGGQSSILAGNMFRDQTTGQINLNINFNTTNINVKRQ